MTVDASVRARARSVPPAAAADRGRRPHRGGALPLLRRRGLHAGLPHGHRRRLVHPQDRDGQPRGERPHDPRREPARGHVRRRVPGRAPVRGRLRAHRPGPADRHRPAAAPRGRVATRPPAARSSRPARTPASAWRSWAPVRRASPVPPSCAGPASPSPSTTRSRAPAAWATTGSCPGACRARPSRSRSRRSSGPGRGSSWARSSGGTWSPRPCWPATTRWSWRSGLGHGKRLGVPGEDRDGVVDALDLIGRAIDGEGADALAGKRVGVIGGGSTAFDAAAAAVRLGAAEVTLFYRRGPGECPAYPHAIDLARSLGVVGPLARGARRDPGHVRT